jgi:hypothetical protein
LRADGWIEPVISAGRRGCDETFDPDLSRRDPIFSDLFERHHRLTLAIVEFELAPNRFRWGAAPALGEGLQLP